ncbi:Protein N-acetyltransferase, RimJ/RimL family [Gracilibacillus ureilyticus]|uniref:Protein N-acetyltransferase, RimJ/RimL family n=1 Tax=Gracilibacillus ureilyticus TaxID=531814 RepID=A0A1H9P8M6_9BACI|nr:GNAT family protein [Gracilibacillus ureilyticus]SER44431.1 Protein N-acetyltransferase, RimJ/RimL family [Gracilibacillus ureilyticus]
MIVSLYGLEGEFVKLAVMNSSHTKELFNAAKDASIWRHLPKTIQVFDDMQLFVNEAIEKMETGTEIPFVIIDKQSDEIVGSTRFLDISNFTRSLEIGWTWLTPHVWGTKVNMECKYLLLKYCFEKLNLIRVQLKTDEQNIRSQKAIERIGCKKEGILRNHMIRKDGTYRNSVIYSIIENDWISVKHQLENTLYRK